MPRVVSRVPKQLHQLQHGAIQLLAAGRCSCRPAAAAVRLPPPVLHWRIGLYGLLHALCCQSTVRQAAGRRGAGPRSADHTASFGVGLLRSTVAC